ncbi:MAG: signal peptide peptidase SppA [Planctomycetes bacterium]|nr:signal peptide peptidase SppA [Planctomycetota bacterium]
MSELNNPALPPAPASPIPPRPPAPPPPPPSARRGLPLGCILLCLFCGFAFCVGSGLLLLIVAGATGSAASKPPRRVERFVEGEADAESKVLRINVHDVIIASSGSWGRKGKDPAGDLHLQLQQAGTDPTIKAILLDIDSPGGGVTECDEMYEEVVRWKQAHPGVPVVALFGGTAASGGYYLGCAADWIVAHPSTLTGSIGVILSYLNFEDVMKKYGVKEVVYKSGPKKDIISISRMPTPEEEAVLQSVVVDNYGRFVDVVAAGRKGKARGLTREAILPLADGSVYSGRQALENGLVDQIGYAEDALAKAKGLAGVATARLIEYEESKGLGEMLFGGTAAPAPEALLAAELSRLVELSGPRLLYLWRGR